MIIDHSVKEIYDQHKFGLIFVKKSDLSVGRIDF